MPAHQRNPCIQGLQHRDRIQHNLQAVFDGVNENRILINGYDFCVITRRIGDLLYFSIVNGTQKCIGIVNS